MAPSWIASSRMAPFWVAFSWPFPLKWSGKLRVPLISRIFLFLFWTWADFAYFHTIFGWFYFILTCFYNFPLLRNKLCLAPFLFSRQCILGSPDWNASWMLPASFLKAFWRLRKLYANLREAPSSFQRFMDASRKLPASFLKDPHLGKRPPHLGERSSHLGNTQPSWGKMHLDLMLLKDFPWSQEN